MAIGYDTKAQAALGSGDPITLSYTCGASAKLLVVFIIGATTTARTGADPTYNGVAMTQVGARRTGTAECTAELWYLANPATGAAHDIIVQNDGAIELRVMAASFTTAASSAALDQQNYSTTDAQNPSVSVTTTADGEVVVGVLGHGYKSAPTGRSGTTVYENDEGNYSSNSQYYLQASKGTWATSWNTGGSDDVAMQVGSFKEAAAAFKQPLSDSVTPSDSAAKKDTKAASDSATASDANSAKPGKVAADTVTLGDVSTRAPEVGRSDSVTSSDDISGKAVGQAAGDGVTPSDAAALEVGQALSDSVTPSDVCSPVLGGGGANWEKDLDDSATVSDAAATYVEKAAADSVAVGDQIGAAVGKGVADSVTPLDGESAAIGKAASDSVNPWDTAVKEATVPRSDSVAPSDLCSPVLNPTGTSWEKDLSDAVTPSDACGKGTGKARGDGLSLADVFAGSTGKALADSAAPADLVAKAVDLAAGDSVAPLDAPGHMADFLRAFGDTAAASDHDMEVLTAAGTIYRRRTLRTTRVGLRQAETE